MIRLYGDPVSRAHRVMWMLEELGLEYELKDGHEGPRGSKVATTELLALNPGGKVPVLASGAATLFESFGINLYLAMTHASELQPRTHLGWGQVFQWTLFAATELERPVFEVVAFYRDVGDPKTSNEDSAALKEALELLERPLKTLDAALTGTDYLVEDRFTVADLNMATVMAFAQSAHISFDPYPGIRAWLPRCLGRPACGSVFQRVVASAQEQGAIGEMRVRPGS